MRMDSQVMEALEVLGRERGVAVETILDALANALVSAYKRSPGAAEEARVTIDPDSGDIIVYAQDLDEDGNVIQEWEDTPRTSAASPPRPQSRSSPRGCARRSASRSLTSTRAGRAISSPASSSRWITGSPSSIWGMPRHSCRGRSESLTRGWSGATGSRRSSSRCDVMRKGRRSWSAAATPT